MEVFRIYILSFLRKNNQIEILYSYEAIATCTAVCTKKILTSILTSESLWGKIDGLTVLQLAEIRLLLINATDNVASYLR